MTFQLPVHVEASGKRTEGFCTPKEDKAPQKMSVTPNRVIPIIFLPGIMGSNLRLKQPRQFTLKKPNDIAWRPDRKGEALDLIWVTPAYRQQVLDPFATEVDTYDNGQGPTGTNTETSDERHAISSINVCLPYVANSPLLTDDPPTASPRRTKQDKAKERGWQEVMFSSYWKVLEHCESSLNRPDLEGVWKSIVDRSPAEWQAVSEPALHPLTMKEVKEALTGTWFPVHAMGYNWLQSNAQSGQEIASRIRKLIEQYAARRYHCEKVIIATHSMGGLVARAAIHPEIGNALEKVLGIVHGVMPSQGAPAAYRRMRCGFEEGLLGWAPAPKVLGNMGPEVTAVLGNSPGGLQLLPSCAYGNGWLEVRQQQGALLKLPLRGDPYEEIYKLRNEWFRLLQKDWLNPANRADCTLERAFGYLDAARDFHLKISDTFHPLSFAHYGGDDARPSWEKVVWRVGASQLYRGFENYQIVNDNFQGAFALVNPKTSKPVSVVLAPPTGPGDQTVPLRSADHQRLSGRFQGIFMQTGYEHQASYGNDVVLRCTLYSLIKIILAMKWSKNA